MKPGLVDEYRNLAVTCSRTDYSNKASVKLHNKAATRMYEIADEISKTQSYEQLRQFTELLDVTENKTNKWAAIQILEKLDVDDETEAKALSIIKAEALGDTADALGFQIWLKNWTEKKNK